MQTPKLRFKADDGSAFSDWEKEKFGNFITTHSEKTSDKEKYPLYSLTIESGVQPKTERYEREFLVKKEGDNYKIVPPNGFVYNPMNLRFGALKVNHEKFAVSVSGYYDVFSLKNESTLAFWENYLITPKMLQYYYSIATGSLIEKLRVHYSQFTEITKKIPSLPEQKKIADFLSAIDTVIEKQQATVEAWEQRKKGVMQKLFNQEVRFKADDGNDFPDWEEKTLGNIFVERTERSVGGEELLSVTIAQGVIRQSDSDKRNNSSENKSNYKVVKKNDLAYNTMRMWQGAEGVSEYDGIVSPAYTIVAPKAGNNVKYFEIFFKQLSMLHLFQRYSQGLTSDTWNLKFPAFAKIKCQVPCEKEQDKIVNCISYLDDVIKKQKEILEKWQEFKKGLLQQMFV